jgi:LacI family transcriptional regulator
MRKPRTYTVFVQSNTSYAYGRRILEGIAEYAHEQAMPWDLRYEIVLPGMEELRQQHFDGLIIFGTGIERTNDLTHLGLPIVRLSSANILPGIPHVVSDSLLIGEMAAAHFLERLYRNFAFVGSRDVGYSRVRCAAFCKTLGSISVQELSLPPYPNPPESVEKELAGFLRQLPRHCALFCASDVFAGAVVTCCAKIGLRIPDDIAVLGVDNDPLRILSAPMAFSSIDPGFDRVGRRSAARLHRLMLGKSDDGGLETVPPSKVILRRSTDHLATDDEVSTRAVAMIRSEAMSGLEVSTLCRRLGIGRRAFERRFRKLLGRSPAAEIRRARIEHAASLLSTTDLSIETIAERAGYSDRFHFSSAFRRAMGVSPRAWRGAPAQERKHT